MVHRVIRSSSAFKIVSDYLSLVSSHAVLAVMDNLLHVSSPLSVLALLAVFSPASLPVAVLQFGINENDGWIYEQTGSLSDAVEWTFNGENRCDGCE